jgi:drug/metabolite transporter (DMT)-like permease
MAVGQTYSPPTHAAMILSLEGVFASVASYTFLDETLSYRELSGCALMLLAALTAKVGIQCIDGKQGVSVALCGALCRVAYPL